MPETEIQLGLEREFDKESKKFIGRGYYGNEKFTIYKIFNKLQTMQKEFPEDSVEYLKINKLLNTRNLDTFQKVYSKNKKTDINLVNKLFEILSSDDLNLTICSKDDIITKMKSGNIIYEDNTHKIDGIERQGGNYDEPR